MDISRIISSVKSPVDDAELQELTRNVIRERDFYGLDLYFHNNNFWCPKFLLKSVASFQNQFQAKDTDVLLATSVKSGTTWLKALTFTIINRTKYSPYTGLNNPLITTNPHELVLNCEVQIYTNDQNPNLDHFPAPRLFNTHLPFSALPKSVLDSKCRIIHICRNPLDNFVSLWQFVLKIFEKHANDDTIARPSVDDAFELFCRGVHIFGPFWEHTLGFWRASIESPERVLFLKYEDLNEDINTQVKKIANFIGFGFTIDEEKQGVVEHIANICSFENLKNLQVNKDGQVMNIMNSSYFRKGEVGDWVNTVSPSRAKILEDITKQKLDGSGFMFKTFCD